MSLQRRCDAQTREKYAETPELGPEDFILPLFVREAQAQISGKKEISGLAGVYSYGIEALLQEMPRFLDLGLRKFLLFASVDASLKDACGSVAQRDDALIPRALRALRERFGPAVCLLTDICLCAYTNHGHCGILSPVNGVWQIDNAATLPHYVAMALAHARAGADWVAPSGMMDAQVAVLRQGLDAEGFSACKILAYSAKYASAFYGPFRFAAGSAPQDMKTSELQHRKSYQMDCRNAEEALKEIESDLNEGAEQVIVKPATMYLDVVYRAAQFLQRRGKMGALAVYHVSGEYMMWRSAVNAGALDEFTGLREIFISLRRAGAGQIISYAAPYYVETIQKR